MPRLFLLLSLILLFPVIGCNGPDGQSIDRYELVHRHFPRLKKADPLSPFTVGNGEFAYTVDITGLQTFPDFYEKGIPLATQSNWGWHTIPNSHNYSLKDATGYWEVDGRRVPYASLQRTDAGQWLRANPHRLHLGRIGFHLSDSAGNEISIGDITAVDQAVDLWQGIIKSSFKIEGNPVVVETVCHPDMDQIGVRVQSMLLQAGQIGFAFEFPYGSPAWGKDPADWGSPGLHSSEIIAQDLQSAIIGRTLDDDRYFVSIRWLGNAEFTQSTKHSFLLAVSEADQFEFSVRFSEAHVDERMPSVHEVLETSKIHWRNFWESGGAVDLSQSKDSRARELERRIVLSRYLTAVQCSGSLPPAETGLTFNSWYGKFHLEMDWWHGVHFALWGHPEILENRLPWYRSILPMAKHTAENQGYQGARWPKMVSVDGREGPSSIGVYLIWQQPHPIYYADLVYRLKKDSEVLEQYKDIVFSTADFMASFARWDEKTGRYVLASPLVPAQEIYGPEGVANPAFELAYWRFGLKTAQLWRERLGMPRVGKWDQVLQKLANPPQKDGAYQNAEVSQNTFEDPKQRRDHPALLGAFGMLPNDAIDLETMRNTLERVIQSWDWQSTWGWDYPLIAMTAARVGKPEIAVRALMLDVQKNRFLNNGHNYQDDRLPIYLPGNGGLLAAVAMMAAGWEGAPDVDSPGFPKDGNWVVKHEGLFPLP